MLTEVDGAWVRQSGWVCLLLCAVPVPDQSVSSAAARIAACAAATRATGTR